MHARKRAALRVVLIILCAVLLFTATYFSVRPKNILPDWFSYALYAVREDTDMLRRGNAALVEREEYEQGGLAAYYDTDGAIRYARIDMSGGTPSVGVDGAELIGTVRSRIFVLGAIAAFLSDWAIFLWGLDLALALFLFDRVVSLPSRRRAARKREMMRRFQEMGERFEDADAGVDY